MKVQFRTGWIALFAGCIAVSASADSGLTLKYKFNKGDVLVYRSKSDMKQTQKIADMPLDNEMESDSISTFTVTGIDEKGNYEFDVKAERLKVRAAFAALGELKFDSKSSERDKSSVLGGALTPLYERLSGITYQTKISPVGEVLEIKGYSDQVKDIVENNPLAAQFSGGASDEAPKQGLRDLFVQFGKKAIQPGDSWTVPNEVDLAGIGKSKGTVVYKYLGPDKVSGRETAKIEVSGEMALEINVEQGGAKVTGTIRSSAFSGTIQIDVATGRIARSEGDMTLAGDLTIDANGMTIPLRNEQTMKTSYELLEKVPD